MNDSILQNQTHQLRDFQQSPETPQSQAKLIAELQTQNRAMKATAASACRFIDMIAGQSSNPELEKQEILLNPDLYAADYVIAIHRSREFEQYKSKYLEAQEGYELALAELGHYEELFGKPELNGMLEKCEEWQMQNGISQQYALKFAIAIFDSGAFMHFDQQGRRSGYRQESKVAITFLLELGLIEQVGVDWYRYVKSPIDILNIQFVLKPLSQAQEGKDK